MRLLAALRPLALAVLAPLAACGGDEVPDEGGGLFETLDRANALRESAGSVQERMEQLAETAERGLADPVDFRRLRALLPARAAGLERTAQEGSQSGAAGFTVSQAEGTYEADSSTATLAVSDFGGAGAGVLMAAAWTLAEVDRETDTLFERTVEIAGYPGYESHDTSAQRGEVQLLVADRFLVQARGTRVSHETLRALATAVDLATLEGWKDEGRRAE